MNKRSYPQLSTDIAAAAEKVKIGGQYRHYKNQHIYRVLGFAVLESTNEAAVLYQPMEEGSDLTFVRPASEWLERVEWDGQMVQRFEEV